MFFPMNRTPLATVLICARRQSSRGRDGFIAMELRDTLACTAFACQDRRLSTHPVQLHYSPSVRSERISHESAFSHLRNILCNCKPGSTGRSYQTLTIAPHLSVCQVSVSGRPPRFTVTPSSAFAPLSLLEHRLPPTSVPPRFVRSDRPGLQ